MLMLVYGANSGNFGYGYKFGATLAHLKLTPTKKYHVQHEVQYELLPMQHQLVLRLTELQWPAGKACGQLCPTVHDSPGELVITRPISERLRM